MAHDLLIGTYTRRLPHVDGHADGVLAARVDGDRIADVRVAATVTNPSWVALAPDGRAVYTTEETGPDGRLHALARDAQGMLTPLGSVSSGGADPAHLLVHPSGRFLIAGTYSGGSVSVFALGADGSIGDRTAFVQHEGRGPDDERQDGPHVHQLSVDPVTGDVVVVDLGLGQVRWYALSAEGALALREDATVALGAAGPRHLVFHPDGRHALVVGELDNVLHVLRREGDRFVLVGGASTRAAVAAREGLPTGENTTAAVRLSPDGRTALVSNRGDDTIAVFAFDAEASALALEAVVPAHGRTPRDLVLSPEGDRVLVACQDSDEITVFSFAPGTRELRFVAASPVPTPVCLVFA